MSKPPQSFKHVWMLWDESYEEFSQTDCEGPVFLTRNSARLTRNHLPHDGDIRVVKYIRAPGQ